MITAKQLHKKMITDKKSIQQGIITKIEIKMYKAMICYMGGGGFGDEEDLLIIIYPDTLTDNEVELRVLQVKDQYDQDDEMEDDLIEFILREVPKQLGYQVVQGTHQIVLWEMFLSDIE